MKLQITQVAPRVTKQYSYTHRIEVIDFDNNNASEISAWFTENKIPYSRISYKTFYLNPESASAFIMRWS